MKKRLIPALIAIVLIFIILLIAGAQLFFSRYSYSRERQDLSSYFGVAGEELAIVLQDEMVEEKAIQRDGQVYFDIDTVHKYLNEGFYGDMGEGLLLYTTALDTYELELGTQRLVSGEGEEELEYLPAYVEHDKIYIAADYIRRFTNFSLERYNYHIQLYTRWGERSMAKVSRDTQIRVRGGVKSPILADVAKGEAVEILETMENWVKVKNRESIIGYVPAKYLSGEYTETMTPVADYVAREYTGAGIDGKVSLGWHAIGGVGGNGTLESAAAETAGGMNVIAPTWYSMNDNEGGIRTFGSRDYVQKAHALGLKVWAVADDFNYNNETQAGINISDVLSSTSRRTRLVANIVNAAVTDGVDGINLDFEKISSESGVHYVQFLREISVECRKRGLTLSVDNYVPFGFNDHYRLDIQGQVADYVIIMGYDEHWHGSKDPGSVASIGYVKNGLDKTLSEVPASKVVNGLPFYSIVWKINGENVTDDYLTIRNTEGFLAQTGAEIYWDEESGQNFAQWDSEGISYKLWIEDGASLQKKLDAMSERNIAGAAVWRLGYGTSQTWNLIKNYVNS